MKALFIFLFILSPLLLFFGGCAPSPDREVRAFNACLTRHLQDAPLCEAPRQATQASALVSRIKIIKIGVTAMIISRRMVTASGLSLLVEITPTLRY